MVKRTPDYKRILSDVKNNSIKNIILLWGQEDYLIKWSTDIIKDEFLNDSLASLDYQIIKDYCDIDISDIISSLETLPFISEKRIVHLRDFPNITTEAKNRFPKEKIDKFTMFLHEFAKNATRTLLIFSTESLDGRTSLSKTLKKLGNSYEFNKVSEGELVSFAGKRIKQAGKSISNDNMRFLIDSTGYFYRDSEYDLNTFMHDLLKLMAFSSGDVIVREDIESCISGVGNSFVFDLMDLMMAGEKGNALEIMDEMLKNLEKSSSKQGKTFSLIGTLASQFELMLSVNQLLKEGNSIREISKLLGANEYRVRKVSKYAMKFSQDRIRKDLLNIYKMDSLIKTGEMEDELALQLFVMNS